MSFPGFPGGSNQQSMDPEAAQQQAIIKAMQAGMESCPVKMVISGGAGFALGGVFGLFMASVSSPGLIFRHTSHLTDLH